MFNREAKPFEKLGIGKDHLKLNYSEIKYVEVEDVETNDHPDYCNAFIAYAEYYGREMTEEELELLNEDGDFVLEAVMESLH